MEIRASRAPSLRVTVGRLIDGTDAPPVERAALLVIGDQIAAAGPADTVPAPEDALQLDVPDGTALPGLIDSHVHVTFAGDIDPLGTMAGESDDELVIRGVVNCERMVRAGITTAFDCGSRNRTGFAVRTAIQRRQAVGPRLLVTGRPVTPPRGHCHWLNGEVDGVAGARGAVRRLLDDEGADAIKMMATGGGMTTGTDSRAAAFEVEVLAAAADEAHRRGRMITTHAHGVPGIRNATIAGIDAIQHVSMLGPDWGWAYDEDVARMMAERGTRACPTMGYGMRSLLEGGPDINYLGPNPYSITRRQTIENGRRLREAGIRLIPATDAGVVLTDFGEELFFELDVYVRIGFTPLDAIRAATRDAARHLGLENVTGALRPGLSADVLVVRGRPDEDIAALRDGQLVLRAGQPIQATPARPAPRWSPTLLDQVR